jgi:CheY-like chemotaxis protein
LQAFHVDFTRVANMDELKEAVEKLPRKIGEEKRAVVSMIEANLYDENVTKRLALTRGMKIVLVGFKEGVHEGTRHFPAVGEIIPVAFLEDVAVLVEESLQFRRSQAMIEMDEEEEPNKSVEKACELKKLRVLCAEDNMVNQKILMRMLKRIGVAEVEVVENGKLAVEREAEKKFDIILMDMQMPVMDGVDATKLIVARQGGHRVPLVVFVTAHVSASFEAQCMECGATAYLPKPYTFPVLKEVLEETAAKL